MILCDKMAELQRKVVCRESQLNDLLNLLGACDEPLPYSLFVSGCMGTGKTLCITSVLHYLEYKHVVINCIECYSPKVMYESILCGLWDEESDIKCETLSELINKLNQFDSDKTSYSPVVIVFDKAERLRNMDPSVVCTFLRLREFCDLNICTIFVTHLVYDNFYFKMGVREPIKLFFPNYSKEELFKIIFLHQKSFVRHVLSGNSVQEYVRKDLETPEFFANFLNAFLSVFYRPCRDLIELRYMARVNFVKYCEPIIGNEINPSDLTKLWRHIAPILKTSLEHLYLRIIAPTNEVSSAENTKQYEVPTYNLESTLKEELMSTKTFAQSFELPYYAKYLLIAAYLASYNPPKEDKRLFMKNHGKQRKRMQQVKAKAKITEKLNTQLGPKVFTLDRLLAIFYSILEEKIGLTSNLLAQIATLVELKLIAGSKEIDLDVSKYKCIVGYDFISAVAETVGFNVRKYLYDFM